jgi:hypothetical protein
MSLLSSNPPKQFKTINNNITKNVFVPAKERFKNMYYYSYFVLYSFSTSIIANMFILCLECLIHLQNMSNLPEKNMTFDKLTSLYFSDLCVG